MERIEANEQLEHPERVVVTTGTFYPAWYAGETNDPVNDVDKVRGDLALELLSSAKNANYQIVVIDGGSSKDFLNALKDKNIPYTEQSTKGMSPGRQQGFKIASDLKNAEAIVWVEPEKVSFVRDCLMKSVEPVLNGEADLVVPARDEEAWSTYPDYQRKSEQRANQHWNAVLHAGINVPEIHNYDSFFGPRVFRNHPKVLEHFLHEANLQDTRKMKDTFEKVINPKRYSDATFFPVATALRDGLRVQSVTVPYKHPNEQVRTESDSPEFAAKRLNQRRGIVGELVKHLLK
jgi:hypothetical protein